MDDKQIREDIKDTRSDETPPCPRALIGQILIVAVIIGIATESWQWAVGSLLILLIALMIRLTALILVLLLSLCWALIGYEVGRSFFDPPYARFILTGVCFLVAFGVNRSDLNWNAGTDHE